jgi:hypothetical protein
VPQIDNITALGRLLRDGVLRDAYAAQPSQTVEKLGVAESDRPPLLQLNSEDLEFQAQTLLRKRFETVSRLIPITCSNLREAAWSLFMAYARSHWPAGQPMQVLDARDFVRCLQEKHGSAIAPSETNRIRFALSQHRISIHFLKTFPLHSRPRHAVQLFFRFLPNRWSELLLYFALSGAAKDHQRKPSCHWLSGRTHRNPTLLAAKAGQAGGRSF